MQKMGDYHPIFMYFEYQFLFILKYIIFGI